MTAPEHLDDLPRRWPGERLFCGTQCLVDVAPVSTQWVRDVAAAQADDTDTLLRIREGLAKL